MKILTRLVSILLFTSLFSACNEGPAEKKGKEIDKAVEQVQEKINPKGPAQKAGEKIDEATDSQE